MAYVGVTRGYKDGLQPETLAHGLHRQSKSLVYTCTLAYEDTQPHTTLLRGCSHASTACTRTSTILHE
jgi:hypothetical protein